MCLEIGRCIGACHISYEDMSKTCLRHVFGKTYGSYDGADIIKMSATCLRDTKDMSGTCLVSCLWGPSGRHVFRRQFRLSKSSRLEWRRYNIIERIAMEWIGRSENIVCHEWALEPSTCPRLNTCDYTSCATCSQSAGCSWCGLGATFLPLPVMQLEVSLPQLNWIILVSKQTCWSHLIYTLTLFLTLVSQRLHLVVCPV